MACDLCDLPTPDPPVTGEDGAGIFCCRGCREVAQRLEDFDPGPPAGQTGAAPDSDSSPAGTPSDQPGRAVRSESSASGRLGQARAPASRLDTGDPDAGGEEVFFAVEGMHCGTCELFLEATATDHPAVADASASYPTGSIRLVYDEAEVAPADLSDLLDGTGYAARPIEEEAPEEDGPVPRLLVGGFFGMMTMLWYLLFLYPAYLGLPADVLLLDVQGRAGTYLLANTWVMATVILGYTGYPILRGAYVSLRAGQPNMDLLVALAAGTAYTYSAVAVLLGHAEVYFDIAVVVILVVTLGEYYKRRVTDRAAGALADLTRERAGDARRRSEDGTESVGVDDLAAGEEVVVRAGERIPLDGTVLEGHGAVDASLVTGESVPERRSPGDEVVGGAEVCDGALVVLVDAADESTLDRVVRRLWTIQTSSSGVQRLADRIALVFVPLVVALAIGAGLVHWLLGADPLAALLTGLTVLIVSCPCALGLATPLSVASATRAGLERGVAVLDETVFERATDVDVVAVDKTGTLTTGEMRVESVVTADVRAGGSSQADLLTDGGMPRDHGSTGADAAGASDTG
ncbi:MAG: HAD-IC family P-type ATPase, partial [Haloarculaceae archaeon]